MRGLVSAVSLCAALAVLAPQNAAHADEDFLFFTDMIDELDDMVTALEFVVPQVHGKQAKAHLKAEVDGLIERLQEVSKQLRPPGKWHQANWGNCPHVCKSKGLKSKPSPEGALCASGENRFPSAQGKIKYTWGTWGGMRSEYATSSKGAFCYGPGQKKDYDKTDRTVACFCGK